MLFTQFIPATKNGSGFLLTELRIREHNVAQYYTGE